MTDYSLSTGEKILLWIAAIQVVLAIGAGLDSLTRPYSSAPPLGLWLMLVAFVAALAAAVYGGIYNAGRREGERRR